MIFLYFHGLNSDSNSRKYLNLKEYFQKEFEFDCLEWKNDDYISILLDNAEKNYENHEDLILFGDSTGANFTYQLRERRKEKGLKSILILSSPLLDKSKRIADFPFPKQLKKYLAKIENPENAFIIAPEHDELIDHSWLFKKTFKNTEILKVNDSHRLPNFKEYLPQIRDYINLES
ncbi:MAG: hypothetical protein WCY16_00715 [Weeksellaceae bacterium]